MESVDQYINGFPVDTQSILREIRDIIKANAPGSREGISYGMPAYKSNGKPLVYFAGFKNHIGLYATPTGHEKFEAELKQYKHGKGSVQFPLDNPIPYDLIKRIVLFRFEENKISKNNL